MTATILGSMTAGIAAATLLAAADAPAAEQVLPVSGPPAAVFAAPASLREVSGLALAADGRLFAHNDEAAIAYEFDLDKGRVVRALVFGTRPIFGDFEGVAISGGRIHLVASDGRILSRPLDGGRGARAVDVVDTGLGRKCEIEGIAPAADPGGFFLLCKRVLKKSERDRLRIYEWAPGRPLRTAADVAFRDIAPGTEDLRPSDLARDPETGRFLVLASGAAALIELSAAGEPLGFSRLDKKRHHQPEAIAVLPDGRLVIGDEGDGGPGRLTIYRYRARP